MLSLHPISEQLSTALTENLWKSAYVVSSVKSQLRINVNNTIYGLGSFSQSGAAFGIVLAGGCYHSKSMYICHFGFLGKIRNDSVICVDVMVTQSCATHKSSAFSSKLTD